MAAGRPHIVFAGGGTGGHLFPALAIAEEIKAKVPDAEITFIGTKEKIEARVVPQRGYRFATIWISGLRRSLTLSNLLFPLKVVVAMIQSFLLMKTLKPDVVVGTGGYVSGPPLLAATMLRIPTLIQEQNSYPGATTRSLARRVNEVHITFEATRNHLPGSNVKLSGNPTNRSLGKIDKQEALKHFGLTPQQPVVLVFGGSLGAASINAALDNALTELEKDGVQIIWQTGVNDYNRIAGRVADERKEAGVRVMKFIEQMHYAYAAADVAVCRAGATTLAELAVCGVPAVLVPYPHAAGDHQTANARAFVDAGAAVLLPDSEIRQRLGEVLRSLLADTRRLAEMSVNARVLAQPDAARVLAEAVLNLAARKE